VGLAMQLIDPLEATNQFLQQGLVDGVPWAGVLMYLIACSVVTVVMLGVLFLYATPRLGLDGGKSPIVRTLRSLAKRVEASQ